MNQDQATGSMDTEIWLDLFPSEIQTRIATYTTAGVQSRDFFNLALSSKEQARAVWNVSKKPVDLNSFLLNDSTSVEGIGNSRTPTALEIARQFEGCGLHTGTRCFTAAIKKLLENTRITSWDLSMNTVDLMLAVLQKAEPEHLTLEVHSLDKLTKLFARLAFLPLKTLQLQFETHVSLLSSYGLADACRKLARFCPSLGKMSLTDLRCDLGSDCSVIEKLPDCSEISLYIPPPMSIVEKLGYLRSVRLELLHPDIQLQFADYCPSILHIKSINLLWKIQAEHGTEEGLLTLQKLRPRKLSCLYLSSLKPVFSAEPLPHLLSECPVTELIFLNFCMTSEEWDVILKQAGPHLHQLKIWSSFCPSTSHLTVLTEFQGILSSILKYNPNLEALELRDRAYCEPWTAPFASRAMIHATTVLVGRVQTALPMLNEGMLAHSVDSFLKMPYQLFNMMI